MSTTALVNFFWPDEAHHSLGARMPVSGLSPQWCTLPRLGISGSAYSSRSRVICRAASKFSRGGGAGRGKARRPAWHTEAAQSSRGPAQDAGIVGLRLGGAVRGKARRSAWHIEAAQSSRGSIQDAGVVGSGTDVGVEDDFVTEVLRDNPSQVEDRYQIGDRFYTLKEKQNLEASVVQKLARAVNAQISALKERFREDEGLEEEEVAEERHEQQGLQRDEAGNTRRVGEAAKPGKPVYISELLREHKGNLYVPEEAFKRPVSELEEFNWNLENLPEMSLDQFLKAVKANQVKLLTSRGISTPRGNFTYWDFVVDLSQMPGEQSLQRRKWSMRVNDDEARTLLSEYSGPQREVETSVTPYVVPPSVAPHPVAESISGRVIMELTVVASIITAAAYSIGGMASVAVFTLGSAFSVIVVHVLWPIASPLVRPFFFLAGQLVNGIWSILSRLVTGGGAGRKGIPALLLEGYRYLTSGALYSSARTLGAILFVLIAMAALAKFTLTRRPKDYTKWDLWQAIDFGYSKPQARVEGTTGVGFADVAGINDVVEELQELVSYLKAPDRFNQMGTKPPHGVLLEGPPGCGKTLLAKAIAGEAGVPFYQMAGSEFVEVLVGVGAARIRDLFKRAKVNRPSVVFIDEIDALGAMRHGATGDNKDEGYNAGSQERETTLNQLLIELDGFDTGKGVVFLGATNRMDMLDPALLRPGRFDRKIAIRPPRAKGRLEILKVHAKSVKLSPSVDLWLYAKNLPGWTGAELAQLLQEAALVAVRHGGGIIMRPDMDQALDRLTMGPERLGLERRQPVHRRMATHEVGMAMASHILRRVENAETEFCDRVSIVPRGETLSRTIFEKLDDEAYLFNRRPSLIHRLKIMLAGRAAEEVIYGRDTSTFSEQHLADATWLARKLITIWNLDGSITLQGDPNPWERESGFSGPPLGFEGGLYDNYGLVEKPLDYATCDDTAARTKRLLDTAYREVFSLLQQHQAAMAKAIYVVMDREELLGEELDFILDKYPAGTPMHLVEDEDEPGELQIADSHEFLGEETQSSSFDSAESATYSPSLSPGGDGEIFERSGNGNRNGGSEALFAEASNDGNISNGNGYSSRAGHLYRAEELARVDFDVGGPASTTGNGESSSDDSPEQEHAVATARTGKGDVE